MCLEESIEQALILEMDSSSSSSSTKPAEMFMIGTDEYVSSKFVKPRRRAVIELCGSKELLDGRSVCHLCPAKFGNIKDLLKHAEVEHNAMDSSGSSSSSETDQSSHSAKHEASEMEKFPTFFKCGMCNFVFAHETGLQLHLRFHALESNTIVCKLCSRDLPDEAELIYHEMAHQHLGDFLTPDPNSQLNTVETSDEIQNMKTVKEVLESRKTKDIYALKTFVCNACPLKYTLARRALMHLLTLHPNDELLTCLKCGYHAEDAADFKGHVKQHNMRKLGCPVVGCYKTFCREADFLNHLDSVHYENIVCEFCGKNFDNVFTFRRHRARAHTTYCFKCKVDFESSAELRQHCCIDPNHGNYRLKQHACPKCGKKFNKKALYIHLRVHYEGLRLPCKMCNKTFQTRQNLNTHMRVHTRERPFLCNHCGKSFSCKASFHHHMKKENLNDCRHGTGKMK